MVRPGNLRNYVTVQKQGSMTSAGTPGPWTNFMSFYADIIPMSGRELIVAQALASPVNTTVRTWYVEGVTAAMRIKFGTRILNIHNVINVEEKNEVLELLCVEVQ